MEQQASNTTHFTWRTVKDRFITVNLFINPFTKIYGIRSFLLHIYYAMNNIFVLHFYQLIKIVIL